MTGAKNNDAQNPVFMESMGSDVSWRLYFIEDALGPTSKHRDNFRHFARKNFRPENNNGLDHEHCAACWVTISEHEVSEHYEGTDPINQEHTVLCPVCFALYKAVCEGIIMIEVTNKAALAEWQMDWI